MLGIGLGLTGQAARRRASGGGGGGSDLFSILDGLGHSANLLTCLDAGALASYGGSGQTWADLSPNNGDFYLGADGDPGADDPTFNGVAGALTEAQYWTGTDLEFTEQAPIGAETFHQAGATFTIAAVVYLSGGSPEYVDALRTGSESGIQFRLNDADLRLLVNDSTVTMVATPPAGANWHFIAVSLDRAGGATGVKFALNDTAETADVSAFPEVGDAPEFGARVMRGSANTRRAAVAVWSVAKSAAQLETIRAALKAQRWTSLYEAP